MKNLSVNLSEKKRVSKRNIHSLVKSLQYELNLKISSLIINFVTPAELLEINNRYLNHNYPTDIITFNYSGYTQSIDGELYISYLEAELNAKRYRVSIEDEISRLIIHGILHLSGYDDMNKNDKLIMKRLEAKLLNKYKYIMMKI